MAPPGTLVKPGLPCMNITSNHSARTKTRYGMGLYGGQTCGEHKNGHEKEKWQRQNTHPRRPNVARPSSGTWKRQRTPRRRRASQTRASRSTNTARERHLRIGKSVHNYFESQWVNQAHFFAPHRKSAPLGERAIWHSSNEPFWNAPATNTPKNQTRRAEREKRTSTTFDRLVGVERHVTEMLKCMQLKHPPSLRDIDPLQKKHAILTYTEVIGGIRTWIV